jgi:hypothetical protein
VVAADLEVGEGVEGAREGQACRVELRGDAGPQGLTGALGEAEEDDPLRVEPAAGEGGDAVGQDPGLAGAGSGEDEESARSALDGGALAGGEAQEVFTVSWMAL